MVFNVTSERFFLVYSFVYKRCVVYRQKLTDCDADE